MQERPIVNAIIVYNDKSVVAQMLIDTGADLTILSRDKALELGMKFEGERVIINGILSSSIFYAKQVTLQIPPFCPIVTNVYISEENNNDLLGRDLIGTYFSLQMYNDTTIIEPLVSCQCDT
ncbi:MAG: aspartyl protease family protein [Candidatus Nitrosocaldaceae archaeon]